MIAFILVSEGLTYAAGLALQKTVYILELPWYLQGRSVFISGHDSGIEKITKHDKHQKGMEDLKRTKEDSASGIVCRFVKHALKFAVAKIFGKTVERDSSLSNIRKGGKREHIGYKQIKVGEGETEQSSFSSPHKMGGKGKSEEKGQGTDGRTGNCSGQHLNTPGGRGIGFFGYCALPAIGNNAKDDSGIPKLDREDRFTPSDNDFLDSNTCNSESCRMTYFVKEDGKVTRNYERNHEYQYWRHLADQLPVSKLNAVMKFLILVSSPLWLMHLLFDRGKIRVVSLAEYNGVDDIYSRRGIGDSGIPWEADRDAIINAFASGLWGVFAGCMILIVL